MVSRLRSKLEEYVQATSHGGAAFKNCFGFIDGTVRPICRPHQNQREVYNGHNWVHGHFNQFHCPTGKLQSSMHKQVSCIRCIHCKHECFTPVFKLTKQVFLAIYINFHFKQFFYICQHFNQRCLSLNVSFLCFKVIKVHFEQTKASFQLKVLLRFC